MPFLAKTKPRNYAILRNFGVFVTFKITWIYLVEAMRDLLVMRIFGFFRMRHHADSGFFECTESQKFASVYLHCLLLRSAFSNFNVLIIIYSNENVKQTVTMIYIIGQLSFCLLQFYSLPAFRACVQF